MKNTYTANGQKLRTEYFTPIVSVAVPVGSTTDLSAANRRKTEINYIGNKEYEIDHWGYHSLKRLHNSEGYIDFEVGDNSFYFDPRYNYYRCDHLGNTREVWQAPYLVHYRMTATMWGQEEIPQSTVQRTQYYPSGLPWEEGLGQNKQPYKYNGKEFIEMHGLDEYYSIFRNYYPAIGRTTTMDPHAENYYNISPYAWCGNNPVNRIDPDGRDWYSHKNEDEKEEIRWTNYKSQEDMDKNDIIGNYLGEVVVHFQGSEKEQLGIGNNLYGKGAVLADIIVYGAGGENDIANYQGYTMSSDPNAFGIVANGDYTVNRLGPNDRQGPYGSDLVLESRNAKIPAKDGVNPAYPNRNPGYLTGVFLHRSNNNGFAGSFSNKNGRYSGVSEGCPLIAPKDWNEFTKQLKSVNSFKLRISR